jgi:lipopolysaccharide export system protein LptA
MITATNDVAVDYGGILAFGQRAVYTADNGLVRVTGQPSWRADLRRGRGEELVIDRTNHIFQTLGHAWLRMPGQSAGSGGFLPQTGNPSASPAETTNRFVEIACDNYEFHTNWAVFRQQVHVSEKLDEQERGTLTCGIMTAQFTGTNQLQSLVAQEQVVIQEETNRFTGGKAVYTATNGVMVMTDKPTWHSGLREGKGEHLQVNFHENELLVQSNATMHLPANELGQAAALPSTTPKTNASPAAAKPAEQFADVFCDNYTLGPAGATFRGGVYTTHPQFNWACEQLNVSLPPAGETSKTVVAERGVSFDVRDEKDRTAHGTGQQAIYTYKVSGKTTNDLVELHGNPATMRIIDSNGTNNAVNSVIIWDRARNTVAIPGNYTMAHRPSGTNATPDIPNLKLIK